MDVNTCSIYVFIRIGKYRDFHVLINLSLFQSAWHEKLYETHKCSSKYSWEWTNQNGLTKDGRAVIIACVTEIAEAVFDLYGNIHNNSIFLTFKECM